MERAGERVEIQCSGAPGSTVAVTIRGRLHPQGVDGTERLGFSVSPDEDDHHNVFVILPSRYEDRIRLRKYYWAANESVSFAAGGMVVDIRFLKDETTKAAA